MKTLPDALRVPVTDLPSAKAWIAALVDAELMFHFEDDPFDCLSQTGLSGNQIRVIKAARDALYGFEWGPRPGLGMWYCPIGYAMNVERAKGSLPSHDDPADRISAGDLSLRDTDDAPGYDYGTPGRYHVLRGGEIVGRFDCYTDVGAAFPAFEASEHFRLCISLETRDFLKEA